MKLNTLAVVAAGAASLLVASCAFAGSGGAPTARVSFADLDLSSPAGVARLHARLRAASESVCPRADFRDLAGVTLENACVARTLEGALAQVEGATALRIARL